MGLGLQISAALPRNFSSQALLNGVMSTLSAGLDPILRPGLSVAPQVDARQLMVFAHPAEEPIFFNWDSRHLTVSARTNGAGPGYHAWLVERLDAMAMDVELGVKWNWQDDDGKAGDETGYHVHRDFKKLQQSMAAWLKALAADLLKLEKEGGGNFAISMPTETRVAGEYFACSPLGFLPRAFFAHCVEADDADAPLFFPWWTRERDAGFWRKHGLVYAWCHVPWRVADSEEETQAMQLALACFKQARQLDAKVALPAPEIAELERLVSMTTSTNREPPPAPDPDRIGFKRRDNTIQLPGQWQIRLPGYFHSHWDSKKGTMTFYFNQRTVHVTTYRFQHKTHPLPDLLGAPENPSPGGKTFEYAKAHLLGRAELTHQRDGTMFGYWMLTGKMVTSGAAATFTVCFDQKDDLDWANATWQSLFKQPQELTGA